MNIKIYNDNDYIKIDKWDLPLPNNNNVIAYDYLGDGYIESFKCPKWSTAIVLENGNYYYFDHNIVNISKRMFSLNIQESWFVYLLRPDDVLNILENGVSFGTKFTSSIKFGYFLKYNNFNDKCTIKKYMTPVKDNSLYYPTSHRPYNLKDGESISKYFNDRGLKLTYNKSLIRDMLIDNLKIK